MKRKTVRLADLSTEEVKVFRDKYDVIICDVDGTIYNRPSTPVPGASQALSTLHANGKKLMILTDNCVRTREIAYNSLHPLFPELELKNFMTSAWILVRHMKKIGVKGKVYVIGVEEGIIQELRNEGYEVVYDELAKRTWGCCFGIKLEDGIGAVVVGMDPNYSFFHIMKAANYLADQSVHFFATQKLVISQRGYMPGCGALVLPIQACSGRKPVYSGKGSEIVVDFLQSLGYNMKRCLLVGDMFVSDIACGNMCGMDTLLVGTGTMEQPTLKEIENGDNPLLIPTYYADSIAELGNLYTKHI